jgi:hypothetical protein
VGENVGENVIIKPNHQVDQVIVRAAEVIWAKVKTEK